MNTSSKSAPEKRCSNARVWSSATISPRCSIAIRVHNCSASSLWKFITQLNRAGHTIVLTTHYLEEAEQLCTRIAMLQRGEIVALDHTRALLQRFSGADLEEVFMQVMRLATHR